MGGPCGTYGRENRYVQGFGEETRWIEYRGADTWIILKCIDKKCDVGVWTGSSWLRIETGGGNL